MPRIATRAYYPTDRPAERSAELAHETDRLFRAMLGELSTQQLAVTILLLNGKSMRDIAADYGVHYNAVHCAASAAQKKLQKRLG